MTGLNDRQTQVLSGQIVISAGHCRVTGRYFEPCNMLEIFIDITQDIQLNRIFINIKSKVMQESNQFLTW